MIITLCFLKDLITCNFFAIIYFTGTIKDFTLIIGLFTAGMTLTDNWIQFNLRYIVGFKRRRLTKHTLNELIRAAIEKTDNKVILASTTVEVVKFPEKEVKPT